MAKNNKSVADVRKEKESNCTFIDFPVGTKVKIVTPCEDIYFFYDETGVVTKNTGSYLGITVTFDEPRKFKDGYIQYDFNFNPKSLLPIGKVSEMPGITPVSFPVCPHCGGKI